MSFLFLKAVQLCPDSYWKVNEMQIPYLVYKALSDLALSTSLTLSPTHLFFPPCCVPAALAAFRSL